MKDFFANHKKACVITASAAAVLLVAVLILSLALGKGKPETADNTSDVSSSDSSSSINIEEPKDDAVSSEVLPDTDNYISPDESEADKVLSENTENTSKQEAVQKPQEDVKKEESVPVSTIDEPETVVNKSSEQLKAERELEVKKYLEENGIDPATAGETGELCPGCGKKIWDPNKYGLGNPGDLDNYENSGYCTGWCTVQVG
ncbi:MAG: hypothetical protein ACI4FN_05875 [Acutalibacteraceae bacterium]